MNDPIDHDGDESRLDKLEQDVSHLLRQAKTHELDLNQVKAALERVLFDTGSTRESLDSLERRYAEAIKRLRAIAEAQASHSEKLDTLGRGQQELKQELHTISNTWLDSLQENFSELKSDIATAQGTQNERFDHIGTRFDKLEAIQTGQGTKLDEILTLLKQNPNQGPS